MSKRKKTTKPERVRDVISFLNLGFKDYLAARVLLNLGLLLQGATLASTSIEKYFKAIIAFRGNVSKGHLKGAHLRSVKNLDPNLYASLNESFLRFLRKCHIVSNYVLERLFYGFQTVSSEIFTSSGQYLSPRFFK